MLSLRPRLAIGPLHTSYRDVVLISLALTMSSTVRADDIDAARRAFSEGVRLLQDGDYEGARRLFTQAEAAHHAPAMVYNLGVTEEHLSHPQAAVDAYDAYLAEVGDAGEFSSPARAAIAQIKARSTRLRISTEPPGVRITVDGFALPAPSPTAFLVPGGRHSVVADAQEWRGEAAVDVTGTGDTVAVIILPSATSNVAPSAPAKSEPQKSEPQKSEPAPPEGPDGFVWGAAFAVVPYHLFGSSSGPNQRDATQLMAGAILELGGAITDRFELFGRAFVGIGPEAKPATGAPFTYAFMGGPGVSFRIGSSVWLGTTFIAGRLETVAHDTAYGTDLVFGAMADASFAILSSSKGQYVVGLQPGGLLASTADNTAFFVPITFGYRAF